jgi:hypothetical protein
MIVTRLAAFCALIISAPALATSEQFDLICKGTTKTSSAAETKTEKFYRHLRIDLAQAKYCEDDCRGIFDLVKINPASIVIDEGSLDAGLYTTVYISYVDRLTGEYIGREDIAKGAYNPVRTTIEQQGKCDPMPFSGFQRPDAKF